MSTLLIIQSYAGAKEQVFRQWDRYRLSGWPILGVTPEDSIHSWPDDIDHCESVGRSGYLTPDTVKFWVRTLEIFLQPRYEKYDAACLVEADSLFLRKPPEIPSGLFTHLTGGKMDGFKATKYFHCPWICDRATASTIVDEGNKLIAEEEFEHGSPDIFLGLITDRRPEIQITETGTFSVNGGDLMNRKEEAIKAIKDPSCWFLHGLKTEEELNWVLENL